MKNHRETVERNEDFVPGDLFTALESIQYRMGSAENYQINPSDGIRIMRQHDVVFLISAENSSDFVFVIDSSGCMGYINRMWLAKI